MERLQIEYGKVQVFENVLPVELYKELLLATRLIGWQFGWNTPSNPNTRYWHHEVGRGRKENAKDISENVKKHPLQVFSLYQDWLRTHLVPPDTKVLRFYLNAHTYGTDGWPHTDTDRGEELTAVLYLNPQWRPEWCGETVVFDSKGDISAAVLPRANRLLTFPSDRLHAPRPLSKAFEGLRVVLVVKLGPGIGGGEFFEQRFMTSKDVAGHLAYFEEVGLQTILHSGRSLQQHLWGTYKLLKYRGADPEVCLAGLFHSIYGTSINSFDLPVDRESVRARIGERAERLVWMFCALQRPECWRVEGYHLPLANGGSMVVNSQDRKDLLAIELANLDEQGILKPERRQGVV